MEIDDRENIQDILLTHNNFSLEKKNQRNIKNRFLMEIHNGKC